MQDEIINNIIIISIINLS